MKKILKVIDGLVIFYLIAHLFEVWGLDAEVALNPRGFTGWIWPFGDFLNWWITNIDPLVGARPWWWIGFIWWDIFFNFTFCIWALYKFYKGQKEQLYKSIWIKIYLIAIIPMVIFILFQEAFGPVPALNYGVQLAMNGFFLIFPLLIVYRIWKSDEVESNSREH